MFKNATLTQTNIYIQRYNDIMLADMYAINVEYGEMANNWLYLFIDFQ